MHGAFDLDRFQSHNHEKSLLLWIAEVLFVFICKGVAPGGIPESSSGLTAVRLYHRPGAIWRRSSGPESAITVLPETIPGYENLIQPRGSAVAFLVEISDIKDFAKAENLAALRHYATCQPIQR